MNTPFATISRPYKLPEATAAALRIEPSAVHGENRLEARAETPGQAEIYLRGTIGKSWYDENGITEEEVSNALKFIEEEDPGCKIRILFNTSGGAIGPALGIYNAFKARSERLTAYVAGYALSIGAILPLACGRVISPKSAVWMMHRSWTTAQGNSEDMDQTSQMLKVHDEMQTDIFCAATGKSREEIKECLEKETWVEGSKAVEFGLADESDSDEDDDDDDAAKGLVPIPKCYLDRCKNLSPEILAALRPAAKPDPTQDSLAKPMTAPGHTPAAPQGKAQPQTQNNTMNKMEIVALLKERGVTVADTATDAELLAALKTEMEKKPSPAPVAGAEDNNIIKLSQAVDRLTRASEEMRRRNVEREIDGLITAAKVTNEERSVAVARALKDETYLPELNMRPSAKFGFEGGNFGPVKLGSESALEEIIKMPRGEAKITRMSTQWKELIVDCLNRDIRGETYRGGDSYGTRPAMAGGIPGVQLPVAANSYSATLITAFLIEKAVTVLQNRWPALKAFTRNFSTDPYKPRATGQVKLVTTSGGVQTNPTNWETGDSTVTNVAISVSQYSRSFNVTNDELNSGLRMDDLVKRNLAVFADGIIQAATAPITEALFKNYEGGSFTWPAQTFGWDQMATLWGAMKKADEKHAVLDGEYYGRLVNRPTYFQPTPNGMSGTATAQNFGWDGLHLNTNWTGAGANLRGFICHPQAIGAIAGLPLTPPQVGLPIPGTTLMESRIELPDVGITIAVYSWFSLASRTFWMSYDLMFGAKEMDTTAGICLVAP